MKVTEQKRLIRNRRKMLFGVKEKSMMKKFRLYIRALNFHGILFSHCDET